MDQKTPSNEPAVQPTSDAKRILLVEDDGALADVYRTRLQTEGFDVRHAADGETALAIAADYHPDLVILDILLPKMSGFEVLQALRLNPATANVKVVVLSAYGEDEDRERAHKLGANDYLLKSRVVLADVIERVKHFVS